ncbi:uncharacterized protein SAPINGB_P005927 [Magnusiomyces paraingens]|uniref:Ubiquitin-protein ligase E3A N-terminal zinc-binding domain-containing protein n=1 Tax=Magnusiomyces paraingens TaxID=2606893 RepID=A0A5E8C2B9_9ASCO|nr:uncharacterized protein SAPINGB_P005927 [Saprochaete ingens]VVT57884.1 unnamed protein product [Saprochaete ingens]
MSVEAPINWSSRLLFRSVSSSQSPPPQPLLSNQQQQQQLPPQSPPSSTEITAPTTTTTTTTTNNFYSSQKFSDKILLPPSVLESLVRQAPILPSPLTFRLTNPVTRQFTHAGVREFSSDEGVVRIPQVIAERIGLEELGPVNLQLVELPKASFLSLQILQDDSNNNDTDSNVQDWKALLEAQLQSAYTALTKNDTLYINDPTNPAHHYKCLVAEVKPADAVLIIDTDVDLEIIPPLSSTTKSKKGKSKKSPTNLALKVNLTDNYGQITIPEITSFESSPVKITISNYNQNLPLVVSLSNLADSPTDLSDPNLLNLYLGSSEDTARESVFLYSTLLDTNQREKTIFIPPNELQPSDSTLYATLTLPKDLDVIFENLSITFSTEHLASSPLPAFDAADSTQCSNCGQFVPQRSYQLHLNFCARNNIPCPQGCGQIFSRSAGGVPATHWHCNSCPPRVFGNTKESYDLHQNVAHTPIDHCDACGLLTNSPNLISLAHHKASVCAAKLHICRFCHLRLPQGPQEASSYGLSGHETVCGSRTADCDICQKAIRLRDMPAHLALHDIQRRSNRPPQHLCANVNCQRTLDNNNITSPLPPFGLCARCFGPLHSSVNDPTGTKLVARIERRYVIQLSRGCGKPFCCNREACATAMGSKLPMAQVMPRVKQLMTLDPTDPDRFEHVAFCVDETTTKRKMFVDLVADIELLYSREWAAKAIDVASGNEAEARRWLERNAVKLSEEQS